MEHIKLMIKVTPIQGFVAFFLLGATSCYAQRVREYDLRFYNRGDVREIHDSLTAMTFNIRYANEQDPTPWSKRKLGIAKLVKETVPDIMGTQEGLPGQLTELDDFLKPMGYRRFGDGRDGKGLGEACAIYWNANRYKFLEGGTFWLSDTPGTPSRHWGNRHFRIATWILLERSHQKLLVLNTHFDHESEDSRVRSAHLVARKLAEMGTKTMDQIVMGDFNAPQGSAPWQILTAQFRDSWDEAYERRPLNIASAHDWKGVVFSKDAFRIDWLLLGGSLLAQKCRLITDQYAPNEWISDHFPYVCDISLGQNE